MEEPDSPRPRVRRRHAEAADDAGDAGDMPDLEPEGAAPRAHGGGGGGARQDDWHDDRRDNWNARGGRGRDRGRNRHRDGEGDDEVLEGDRRRPLLCDQWLEAEEFQAATYEEVHSGRVATVEYHRQFESDSEGEDEGAEPVDEDIEDENGLIVHDPAARRRRRLSRTTRSQPSDGLISDGSFCYLCMKQGAPAANEYREEIEGFLANNLGHMDNSLLCTCIARKYAWSALQHTRKPWGAADVWRHLTEHVVNRKALLVDSIHKLSAYERQYAACGSVVGFNGRPIPPDPEHVKAHVHVLKERVWFAERFDALSNKRNKV